MIERYEELAKAIVQSMCEDYIEQRIIHDKLTDELNRLKKKRKTASLSGPQMSKLNRSVKHINEDILFFKSGKPELYCGISGKQILEELEKRIEEKKKEGTKKRTEKKKKEGTKKKVRNNG